MAAERYRFFQRNPSRPDIAAEVKDGLRSSIKRISPKFFYDERGSQLFEEITRLPEYYLTRTEIDILNAHKHELAEMIGKHCCLLEYGSGSSRKVRILIHALEPRYYVPIDISEKHLQQSAAAIHDDFQKLSVFPTCADYSKTVELPEVIDGVRRCGFFPGSSIGNFERTEAVEFLAAMRLNVGAGGYCIIGFDSRKSPDIVEPAYNDRAGVTAKFNLNLLTHLNRAIGTNFDVSKFRHHAFYNQVRGRIEMHLICQSSHQVQLDGETFTIAKDESVHTENSYKYSLDEVKTVAKAAGMTYVNHWEDDASWFYVVLLQADG